MPRKISTDFAICHGETSMVVCSRPSQPGRTDEVEPAEDGEHDDLEHRVDRDQHGGGFAVAAGQVVPDDHHGDAAGQADDDQAGAVLGQVGQEQPGQGEHQRRAEDPVQDQRADQQFAVAGDGVEAVVADLRQHRVHHDQQAEGDRQRDAVDLDGAQGVAEAGDHAPEQQAGDHGDADPDRQEPVEGGQFADDGGVVGGGRAHAVAHLGGAGSRSSRTADSCCRAAGTTR